MPSVLQFLPMVINQNVGKQTLRRTPEPDAITSGDDNVLQYDRVMETKLAISYAIAIETIYRARSEPFGGKALDIACGPGHLALQMAKELKLEKLTGIDLSEPMIRTATKNAVDQSQTNVMFQQGDATSLNDFGSNEFDLTTMMDAAHHMPTLSHLTQAITEMDRVTKPDGLVVVMDLVRLRTEKLTEKYVSILAHDYEARGLPNFRDDFRHSMYAAWTPDELISSVPGKSKRKWCHVLPKGLPFAQFLFGYPKEQIQLFLRNRSLWEGAEAPVQRQHSMDYSVAKWTMRLAGKTGLAAST